MASFHDRVAPAVPVRVLPVPLVPLRPGVGIEGGEGGGRAPEGADSSKAMLNGFDTPLGIEGMGI